MKTQSSILLMVILSTASLTQNVFAQASLDDKTQVTQPDVRVDISIPEAPQQWNQDAWKEGQRLTSLGWTALKENKSVDALVFFRKALPLHVVQGDDYLGMAKAFEQLGKWQPSMLAYRKALFPVNASTSITGGNEGIDNLLSYAAVALKVGQVRSTYDALDAATRLVNADLDKVLPRWTLPNREAATVSEIKAFIALGFALKNIYGTHEFEKAVPYIDTAMLLKPGWSYLYLHKGRLMQILSRREEAKQAFQKAATLDKPDGTIRTAALMFTKEL